VSGKLALKYIGDEVDAMKAIAQASHKRSLAEFESVCMQTLFFECALMLIVVLTFIYKK